MVNLNQAMRVSFDLDEVLFVNPANHKVEPELGFPKNLLFRERLRLGAPRLIHDLQAEGYEVWVYTSSFRTEKYIRRYFKSYGVTFDGIVNGQRHEAEVQRGRREKMPTKLPNRYRISLHVDDEAIVVTYGKTYGFQVYQLDEQDDDWHDKIMARAKEIHEAEERRRAEADRQR